MPVSHLMVAVIDKNEIELLQAALPLRGKETWKSGAHHMGRTIFIGILYQLYCQHIGFKVSKALVLPYLIMSSFRGRSSGGSFITIIRHNKFIQIMVHNEGVRQALECSEFMQHKIIHAFYSRTILCHDVMFM